MAPWCSSNRSARLSRPSRGVIGRGEATTVPLPSRSREFGARFRAMGAGLDRLLWIRVGCLLAGGALVGLGVNAARRSPLSLLGFEAPVTCSAQGTGTE